MAFAANDGPASFEKIIQRGQCWRKTGREQFQHPHGHGVVALAADDHVLFVAAQTFSTREMIPLQRISFLLQRRLRKARKAGAAEPPRRDVNVSYPYFILCLFSASVHPNEGSPTFFAGQCALIAWALWVATFAAVQLAGLGRCLADSDDSGIFWAARFMAIGTIGRKL